MPRAARSGRPGRRGAGGMRGGRRGGRDLASPPRARVGSRPVGGHCPLASPAHAVPAPPPEPGRAGPGTRRGGGRVVSLPEGVPSDIQFPGGYPGGGAFLPRGLPPTPGSRTGAGGPGGIVLPRLFALRVKLCPVSGAPGGQFQAAAIKAKNCARPWWEVACATWAGRARRRPPGGPALDHAGPSETSGRAV